MRHLPVFIAIILSLSLLCGSCHNEAAHMPSLVRADSIMDSDPDSALSTLQAIDTTTISTPADRALYDLLLTQARVKTDRPASLDLISRAADYYRDHPGPRQRMLSLYYLGQLQREAGLYDEAIRNQLESERLATEQENWFYLGLIDREISIVYHNVYSMDIALMYSQKAVNAFRKSGNEEYWNYERCNLANSYISTGEIPKAVNLLDSARSLATTMGDTVTMTEALFYMAFAKFNISDWQGGIDYLKEVEKTGMPLKEPHHRQALTLAYLRCGLNKRADSVYRLIDTLASPLYVSLHPFYAANGDFEKAYTALLKENNSNNSFLRTITRQKVSKTAFIYDNLLMEQAAAKARNQRLTFILTIAICLCVAFLAATYLFYRRKLLRNRLNALLKDHDILRLEVERLSAEAELITSKQTQWKKLFNKQFNILDRLCGEYYTAPSPKNSNKLAKLIETTIFDLKNNADFINGIFDDIDQYNDNIIKELRESTDKITDTDYVLMALCCSGLSNQAIAIIMSIEIELLYVRRSRLKAKISKLDFPRKAELLDLMSTMKE